MNNQRTHLNLHTCPVPGCSRQVFVAWANNNVRSRAAEFNQPMCAHIFLVRSYLYHLYLYISIIYLTICIERCEPTFNLPFEFIMQRTLCWVRLGDAFSGVRNIELFQINFQIRYSTQLRVEWGLLTNPPRLTKFNSMLNALTMFECIIKALFDVVSNMYSGLSWSTCW